MASATVSEEMATDALVFEPTPSGLWSTTSSPFSGTRRTLPASSTPLQRPENSIVRPTGLFVPKNALA